MNIDTNSKINTIKDTAQSKKTSQKSDNSFTKELSNLTTQKADKKDDKIESSSKEIKKDVTDKENCKEAQNIQKDETDNENCLNASANIQEDEANKNKYTELNSSLQNDKNLSKNPEQIDNITNFIDGLQNVVVEINNKIGQEDNAFTNQTFITNENNDNNIDKENIENKNQLLINNTEIYDKNNIDTGITIPPKTKQQKTIEKNTEPKNVLRSNDNNNFANKNTLLENSTEYSEKDTVEQAKTKTVTSSDGIKKVDTKTNITVDNIVNFDEIAVTKNDVDFFAKLVENGQNNVNSKQDLASSQVSKTLADMLTKAMNENKPIRINFDNDISVIIKVSRDGKISADFLPGSQIAEAYLKENLPILRQKFDDNNIDYDELNHREQKQNERNENQKKGRKDE